MMNLKDAREYYGYFTGKTSEIIRQLGLGGIAIVWLFKTDVAGQSKVPPDFFWPLVLIAIGLALDLLHYFVAASIWGIFQRSKEKTGISHTQEFEAPSWFNWPGIFCFVLKVVAISAAYVLLLSHLARTIF
mgnify:CR=1 FL=1